MVRPLGKASQRAATLAVVLAAGALTGLPRPAQAQFFFWDQPRYSADDVARTAIQHGFRVLTRPQRNDNVYVAEVLDQRGRRERLVVSAESGEVLQRFFLDSGRGYRRYADPSIPRGPLPPGRVPDDDNHDLMSRLIPDDRGTERSVAPDDGEDARPAPRPPRARRPRAASQAPSTVHQTPVESAPLAPSVPTPAPLRTPAPAPAPAEAALPPAAPPAAASPPPAAVAPAGPPPGDKPVRSISRDPLALPGSREHDDAQAAAAKPPAPPAPGAAAKKPAVPAIPVAPLE